MLCGLNMKLFETLTCDYSENHFNCATWIHEASYTNSFLENCCGEQEEIFYTRDMQWGTKVSDFIAANHHSELCDLFRRSSTF